MKNCKKEIQYLQLKKIVVILWDDVDVNVRIYLERRIALDGLDSLNLSKNILWGARGDRDWMGGVTGNSRWNIL